MRLELEAAEQRLDELEEDIIRLDQEEKILCAEVQEAEDPPTQLDSETEETGPTPNPSPEATPGTPQGPGDCSGLIQQLQALIQEAAQPRKKPRSGAGKDTEGDATMDFPTEWNNTA